MRGIKTDAFETGRNCLFSGRLDFGLSNWKAKGFASASCYAHRVGLLWGRLERSNSFLENDMSSHSSRLAWKSLFAAACLLISALIAAAAFAQSDTIRVRVQNDSDFAVEKVKLVNQSTSERETLYPTLRPNSGVRVLDMSASSAARAVQSFELQIDPMGGISGDQGWSACVHFDVTSENGQITKIEVTGPNIRPAVTGKKRAVWDVEENSPQIATISARVVGDINSWRCNVKSIARRSK